MTSFSEISNVNFKAFINNNRSADVVAKKQEIIDGLGIFHNLTPTSILFVGFSGFVMANYSAELYITAIDQEIRDFLIKSGVKITYIPEADLINYRKKFQVVIAVDEFFTYANSDNDQKILVSEICNLTQEFVITTLRDYKNQEFKDREFGIPTLIKTPNFSSVFLEAAEWNQIDRSSWTSAIYQIDTSNNTLNTYGRFNRRTMYFKQLAKFSADAGAVNFLVHKNLMYKGLYKKNYEHVITMRFDQY